MRFWYVCSLWALLGCGAALHVNSPADAGLLTTIDAGEPGRDVGAGEVDAGAGDAGQPTDAGPQPDAGAPAGDAGAQWPDPGLMESAAKLITADATEFTIDQVDAALTHALAGGSSRHLIVYVHGRACGGGGEPSKSLAGAVPELQADYQARVVMFSWPGSNDNCPLGFPESEARASGLALAHVLQRLAWVLNTNAVTLGDITLTLVTHSMGSLVLEEALLRNTQPLPPTLFATAVINSAASATAGHRSWLSRAHFASQLFVTVNAGDKVLAAAGLGRGARLGQSIDGESLAATARYVDFTAANVNHAYYLHSGQKGEGMRGFYDAVMRGQPYNFSTSTALTRTDARDGTFVYVFKGP